MESAHKATHSDGRCRGILRALRQDVNYFCANPNPELESRRFLESAVNFARWFFPVGLL